MIIITNIIRNFVISLTATNKIILNMARMHQHWYYYDSTGSVQNNYKKR